MAAKWYKARKDKSIIRQGSYIGNVNCFDEKPIFPHGIVGVFISGGAKIGKNCIIFQHVTIGSNMIPYSKGKGAPKIGDNVIIGAGAKIIGNVTIGNNCRIGANAVVVEDIPDNCVVVLTKPRIIQKESIKNAYYSKSPEFGWCEVNSSGMHKVTDENIICELGK